LAETGFWGSEWSGVQMILNQLRVPAADFSGETACLKFNEIVETLRLLQSA